MNGCALRVSGEWPGRLPRKIELVINLKTAGLSA
jgi:hypothetical protein